MKSILVVDESRAVRETLVLLLGRDFRVVASAGREEELLALPADDVGLLILGVSPAWTKESVVSANVAGRFPCPILLLVDSKSSLPGFASADRMDWLAKPFSPYELREKVERLYASSATTGALAVAHQADTRRFARYAEFPYVTVPVAAVAKRFAGAGLPILIEGELGSGQERVARALHSLNPNRGAWVSFFAPEISSDDLFERVGKAADSAGGWRTDLFFHSVDRMTPTQQMELATFLDEEEAKGRALWILSTAQEDLLKRVYEGDFLDALYYRLAPLKLRLQPLRDRPDDIPKLAAWFARDYAERLNLGAISLASDAEGRLRDYLWFGNAHELEGVMARTLAGVAKSRIEAVDLALTEAEPVAVGTKGQPTEPRSTATSDPPREPVPSVTVPHDKTRPQPRPTNGDFPYLRVLVNELAHELKNPMVTIKTFTQLLGDRFDDTAFRSRFQETVAGDVDRMDDLLEALLDFARFTHPVVEKVTVYTSMRRVLEEILPDCVRRGATVRWGKRAEGAEVFVDEAQFRYAFKNILHAVLAEIQPAAEIQIELESEGRITVGYEREGGRLGAASLYLDQDLATRDAEGWPLRVLLAKILLERNGGGIRVRYLDGGRVLIDAELPAS
jgi:DNA-binding NtrC family response regulator